MARAVLIIEEELLFVHIYVLHPYNKQALNIIDAITNAINQVISKYGLDLVCGIHMRYAANWCIPISNKSIHRIEHGNYRITRFGCAFSWHIFCFQIKWSLPFDYTQNHYSFESILLHFSNGSIKYTNYLNFVEVTNEEQKYLEQFMPFVCKVNI